MDEIRIDDVTLENIADICKRNLKVTDCIVNTIKINSFVAEREAFQKEVREALEKSG